MPVRHSAIHPKPFSSPEGLRPTRVAVTKGPVLFMMDVAQDEACRASQTISFLLLYISGENRRALNKFLKNMKRHSRTVKGHARGNSDAVPETRQDDVFFMLPHAGFFMPLTFKKRLLQLIKNII